MGIFSREEKIALFTTTQATIELVKPLRLKRDFPRLQFELNCAKIGTLAYMYLGKYIVINNSPGKV